MRIASLFPANQGSAQSLIIWTNSREGVKVKKWAGSGHVLGSVLRKVRCRNGVASFDATTLTFE
jgi:hypothetical protein